MTDAQRKILAKFAHKELPLNRAIKAALCRIEDMEIVLQQAYDQMTYAPEADLLLMRRIKKLLNGETLTDVDRLE